MNVDPVIVLIVRFGIAWLFFAAMAHKLFDMSEFRGVLAAYRLIPQRLVGIAAWMTVCVEFAIGTGALLQFAPAYAAAAVLLVGYAALMMVNLWRGRRFIDCGCGGAAQPLSMGLVIRNLVLAGGALAALYPVAARGLGWLDLISVILGSIVLATLYGAVNQLLAARARLEEWV